jgi:hypothetical protein
MPVDRRLGGPAQLGRPGAAGPRAPLIVHPQRHPDETGLYDLLDRLLQLRAILPGRSFRHGPAVRNGHPGGVEGFGDLAGHLGRGGTRPALVHLGGFDSDEDGAAEVAGLGRILLLQEVDGRGQSRQHAVGDLGHGLAGQVLALGVVGEHMPDQAGGRGQRDAAIGGDLVRLAGGTGGGHQRHGAVRGNPQGALVLIGKGDRHGGLPFEVVMSGSASRRCAELPP